MADDKTLEFNLATIETKLTETQDRWQRLFPPSLQTSEHSEYIKGLLISLFKETPDLLNCRADSIWRAIASIVKLGLKPDGMMGECYLIRYGQEAKLQIGYKGLVELARRSGEISKIVTYVVREGDDFEYSTGIESFERHRPCDSATRSEQPITHAVAAIKLTNGEVNLQVMDSSALDRHKAQYSKGANSKHSPWNTAEEQMCKKTVLSGLLRSGCVPIQTDVEIDMKQQNPVVSNAEFSELVDNFESPVSEGNLASA